MPKLELCDGEAILISLPKGEEESWKLKVSDNGRWAHFNVKLHFFQNFPGEGPRSLDIKVFTLEVKIGPQGALISHKGYSIFKGTGGSDRKILLCTPASLRIFSLDPPLLHYLFFSGEPPPPYVFFPGSPLT